MSKAGMVYLYGKDDDLVDGKTYKSLSNRKDVIERWKKLYSCAYKNCYLQIAPIVNIALINKEGVNTFKRFNFNERGLDGKYLRTKNIPAKEAGNIKLSPTSPFYVDSKGYYK